MLTITVKEEETNRLRSSFLIETSMKKKRKTAQGQGLGEDGQERR